LSDRQQEREQGHQSQDDLAQAGTDVDQSQIEEADRVRDWVPAIQGPEATPGRVLSGCGPVLRFS